MTEVDIRRKDYGDRQVLGSIRFSIAPGEVVALVGPSGVGKSTLLRIVAGIDRRFDGRVERPAAVAMVFQDPTLLPWRSALDNILLPNAGVSRAVAQETLCRVGLEGRGQSFPGQLSLGQQRRLALARALAGSPGLLVLDEPFVSLDPETADQMMTLTERLIAGTRIETLLVTHSPVEASRLSSRILHLEGDPAQLESPGDCGSSATQRACPTETP